MKAVQQILQGSKNIDRMRKEIRTFLLMIVGLIDKEDFEKWTDYGTIARPAGNTKENPFCCWWIIGSYQNTRPTFRCQIEGCGDICGKEHFDYGKEEIPAEFVQQVYGSLPFLLKTMVETFPKLREKVQLFLKATEVQF